MFQFVRNIAIIAVTLLSCGASFAEDEQSANYMMPQFHKRRLRHGHFCSRSMRWNDCHDHCPWSLRRHPLRSSACDE